MSAHRYEVLAAWNWNRGWHAKTKWKIYAKRNEGIARSTIYMHRVILFAMTGCDVAFGAAHHGHHKNGQSLDNRDENLEWLTPKANAAIRLKRGDAPSLEEIIAALAAEASAAPAMPY